MLKLMIAQKNYQRRDEVLLVVIFEEESDCFLSRNFIGERNSPREMAIRQNYTCRSERVR
ncbi:hypothetical protein ALC57_16125 [Trachymyrmex cornetzi]|uniref:Uncharacterized protein n=1 Tax=Trachymyrmex cornetzi TaxID=471704 RepID=A0A151IVG7_9HYME|nr:hypothetical protein ALC57_16125 [Trachymyrmex cornetzi]